VFGSNESVDPRLKGMEEDIGNDNAIQPYLVTLTCSIHNE